MVSANSGQAAQPSRDLRQLMPVLGLKEYWYPALKDQDVRWRKPVYRQMLGKNLCFFRGKSGKVVAVDDACPHRGAMLSHGDIMFKGYITCFYHAFTFDERGQCVAALGDGPQSPMVGKISARVYPTLTLKGVVFAWLGDGEPVDPKDGIPEEFFDPEAMVFTWVTQWRCNWRPALENVGDSHFRYLHRNAFRILLRPIAAPQFPLRGRPTRINDHRLRAVGQSDTRSGGNPPALKLRDPYQDYYPGVDALWPMHRWRLLWSWMFDWAEHQRARSLYKLSIEWGPGQHLPGMFRQNLGLSVYTRWVVPVEEQLSRLFYFHTVRPTSPLAKAWEILHYHLVHQWMFDRNFSEQDARGAIEAYYDTQENLAPTDLETVVWRKFVLSARGVRIDPRTVDEMDGGLEQELTPAEPAQAVAPVPIPAARA